MSVITHVNLAGGVEDDTRTDVYIGGEQCPLVRPIAVDEVEGGGPLRKRGLQTQMVRDEPRIPDPTRGLTLLSEPRNGVPIDHESESILKFR